MNFIQHIIEEDLDSGKHDEIVTRFPPEPNGYLHIGHALSIVWNHHLAETYDGTFHLRFDDTDPTGESSEYIDAIREDVEWLGADWDRLTFASDYFERMYELAERLIEKGKAYVDSLSSEKIQQMRGSWDEPGEESPYRDRPVEENLDLFRRMRAGEFEAGEHVLRAKIDMQADNTLMRDPVLYRILHAEHPRTIDAWCIYPMYDYAHCLEDAFEGITHSLCTLEFENNRELYNWVVEETEVEHQPRQIEFAPMDIEGTVLSKSTLSDIIESDENDIDRWDDPALPTIRGLRRRGVTSSSIRDFCLDVGLSRDRKTIERSQLHHAIRSDLDDRVSRVMAVRDPVPLDVSREDEDEELYVDRRDIEVDADDDFYRLTEGQCVRLDGGPIIRCDHIETDDHGTVHRVDASVVDDNQYSSDAAIHWLDRSEATPCTIHLYGPLFDDSSNDEDQDRSMSDRVHQTFDGYVEPSMTSDPTRTRYQFKRDGYYIRDESSDDRLVFRRIAPLKGVWSHDRKRKRKERAQTRACQKRRKKADKKEESERRRDERERVLTSTARGHIDELDPENLNSRDDIRLEHDILRDRLDVYLHDFNLGLDEADILSGDETLAEFYDEACDRYDDPETVASWIVHEMCPHIDGDVGTDTFTESFGDLRFGPDEVAELIEMFEADRITNRVMRDVLEEMFETGDSPEVIVEREGWESISDTSELESVLQEVLDEHDEQVRMYENGQTNLFNFFIGRVMERTNGQADPTSVRNLLDEKLKEPDDT